MTSHVKIVFLIVVLLTICHEVKANKPNKINSTETVNVNTNTSVLEKVELHMNSMINWMKASAQSRSSFMGRCIGAMKRLRSAILFIVFALGVILTMLKFLTIFVLKGLGIGVTLLVLNAGGLLAKFSTAHLQQKSPKEQSQVHVHVHGKIGHPEVSHTSGYSGPGYGWHEHAYHSDWDRNTNLRNRLKAIRNRPLTVLERLELMKLYEKLGLTQKMNEVT